MAKEKKKKVLVLALGDGWATSKGHKRWFGHLHGQREKEEEGKKRRKRRRRGFGLGHPMAKPSKKLTKKIRW